MEPSSLSMTLSRWLDFMHFQKLLKCLDEIYDLFSSGVKVWFDGLC